VLAARTEKLIEVPSGTTEVYVSSVHTGRSPCAAHAPCQCGRRFPVNSRGGPAIGHAGTSDPRRIEAHLIPRRARALLNANGSTGPWRVAGRPSWCCKGRQWCSWTPSVRLRRSGSRQGWVIVEVGVVPFRDERAIGRGTENRSTDPVRIAKSSQKARIDSGTSYWGELRC